MRFARTALAAAAFSVAMLTVTGPAMADDGPKATPKPVPSQQAARPSAAPVKDTDTPRPARDVPRGAPETGGGPGANPLVPFGGALLAAGAGMGALVLRRRASDHA
ncbi:hypothetical protein AB0O34_22175 [Sphaerisporangium sp. NPDC088356]|uniref:hypothetical protein n=1 Tax=Sphaerisporangium sp. NPDC088356 TaxID=3154871 RepID=UPI003442684E